MTINPVTAGNIFPVLNPQQRVEADRAQKWKESTGTGEFRYVFFEGLRRSVECNAEGQTREGIKREKLWKRSTSDVSLQEEHEGLALPESTPSPGASRRERSNLSSSAQLEARISRNLDAFKSSLNSLEGFSNSLQGGLRSQEPHSRAMPLAPECSKPCKEVPQPQSGGGSGDLSRPAAEVGVEAKNSIWPTLNIYADEEFPESEEDLCSFENNDRFPLPFGEDADEVFSEPENDRFPLLFGEDAVNGVIRFRKHVLNCYNNDRARPEKLVVRRRRIDQLE